MILSQNPMITVGNILLAVEGGPINDAEDVAKKNI